MNTIEVLEKFQLVLHTASWVSDGLRWIGWQIIKMMANAADGLTSMYSQAFKLIDFWNSKDVTGFVATYQPVFWVLGTLGIAWAGLMMIHRAKSDLQQKFNNLLVALLIFIGIGTLTSTLSGLVVAGIGSSLKNSPPAVSIVSNNMTDLVLVDKAGWKTLQPNPSTSMKTINDINYLDINETMDSGGWWHIGSKLSKTGNDVMDNQLVMTKDGMYDLRNMHGFFHDTTYYRYSFHPFLIAFELGAFLIAIVLVIIKVFLSCMEIGFTTMLAQGMALSDIDSGKRNLALIQKLRDTFIVLFLTSVMLQLFTLWTNALSNPAYHQSPFAQCLGIIAGAMFLINGPNIVMSLFGMDAGARGIGATLVGGAMGLRAIGGLGRGMAHGVNNAAHATAHGAARAAGYGAGFANAFRSNKSNRSSGSKPSIDGIGAEAAKQDAATPDLETPAATEPGLGKQSGTDANPTASSVAGPDMASLSGTEPASEAPATTGPDMASLSGTEPASEMPAAAGPDMESLSGSEPMQGDQGELSKPKAAQRTMGQAAPKGASFATGTHTQGQPQTGNIGGHTGAHASIGVGSDGSTQAVSGSAVESGTQSIDNGAQPKQIPAETRTLGQMWGGRVVPALAKHSQTVRLAQRSYNRGAAIPSNTRKIIQGAKNSIQKHNQK
ncbi:pLS20_p028 family conjugation system transmembrane protein (plasmid) [Lacticaseibacillus paracasei]|uniref:pLS20_p028 family conjugation system transmembrane protein n=1 Tax=Lacticaseibacillus paracasei TaxID=1597 RepID=UPI0038503749